MQSITLGRSGLRSSRLAYGCMRIAEDKARGKMAVRAAIENGYTLFDHADIYGDGESEAIFGEVLRESPGLREGLLIMTKCGIWLGGPGPEDPKRYDFRPEHITRSLEGSLKRLGVEQVDFLLLHRPDFLMDAEAVASTLASLQAAGKVAHFGVSNFSPSQVDLLRSAASVPLVVNQVEINIHNVSSLSDGTLDQCQRLGMAVQAWCPVAGVAYPAWGNTFTAEDDARIRVELDRQTEIYGVEDWQIALAWILKLPANVSPIIGSTTPERIAAAKQALDIGYSREDWYRLLEARNGYEVP